MPNRVAGGFSPPAPTTPCVRIRTGRFIKVTGPWPRIFWGHNTKKKEVTFSRYFLCPLFPPYFPSSTQTKNKKLDPKTVTNYILVYENNLEKNIERVLGGPCRCRTVIKGLARKSKISGMENFK